MKIFKIKSNPQNYLVGLALTIILGFTPGTAFSTIFIRDDNTGGDCGTIGIWSVAAKTCTLNTTVSETIQIDSDQVILDGAGHALQGSNVGSGVLLNNRTGITLLNLTVSNFFDGIQLINSNNNTLVDNTVLNNVHAGILLRTSSFNTLVDNKAKWTDNSGIWLWNQSNSNTITGNTTFGNTGYGIFIDRLCNSNLLTKNITSQDSIGIRLAWSSNLNTITNNTMSDHTTWGMDLWKGNSFNNIYNNNFINNGYTPQIQVIGGSGNVFNLPAPVGGNYWDDYDEPTEGCLDVSPPGGFCDATYIISAGAEDGLPWTLQNGWLTITVNIDIKPDSDSNCLNMNGHGVIPVAIFGNSGFDVNDINLDSLSFAGLKVRIRGKRGSLCSFEYVNDDEFLDLVCHFEDNLDNWEPRDGIAGLTGKLQNGKSFEGTDSICVIPNSNHR